MFFRITLNNEHDSSGNDISNKNCMELVDESGKYAKVYLNLYIGDDGKIYAWQKRKIL